jgi:hypothetical protein
MKVIVIDTGARDKSWLKALIQLHEGGLIGNGSGVINPENEALADDVELPLADVIFFHRSDKASHWGDTIKALGERASKVVFVYFTASNSEPSRPEEGYFEIQSSVDASTAPTTEQIGAIVRWARSGADSLDLPQALLPRPMFAFITVLLIRAKLCCDSRFHRGLQLYSSDGGIDPMMVQKFLCSPHLTVEDVESAIAMETNGIFSGSYACEIATAVRNCTLHPRHLVEYATKLHHDLEDAAREARMGW